MTRLDEPRWEFWQTRVWLRCEEVVEDDLQDGVNDGASAPLPSPRYPPQVRWEPQTVVGSHSFEDLRDQIVVFLRGRSEEITCFANTSDAQKLHRQHLYILATAETLKSQWVRDALAPYRDSSKRITEQQYGWWYYRPASTSPYALDEEAVRQHLGSLEDAAAHFARYSMIPERGPKWRDLFAYTEALPLHLMRTVMRLQDTGRLNDALGRGWYLLGIEYQGQTDEQGLLQHRRVQYVVGHTEEYAR